MTQESGRIRFSEWVKLQIQLCSLAKSILEEVGYSVITDVVTILFDNKRHYLDFVRQISYANFDSDEGADKFLTEIEKEFAKFLAAFCIANLWAGNARIGHLREEVFDKRVGAYELGNVLQLYVVWNVQVSDSDAFTVSLRKIINDSTDVFLSEVRGTPEGCVRYQTILSLEGNNYEPDVWIKDTGKNEYCVTSPLEKAKMVKRLAKCLSDAKI
ncbi:MAG: hypothetical protein N2558_03575 [Patescibacteria group bacterium]|nr:hypothetical protein [Patescibacteria group bacterium]